MRFLRWLPVYTLALAFAFSGSTQTVRAQAGAAPAAPAPPPLTLTSTSFGDGTIIPDKYTQAGNQTSPELSWINTPAGTVSFVLHMHDLDVSRNKTTEDQLHWLVWNIPGNVIELSEGLPMGQMKDGAYQVSASRAGVSWTRRSGYWPAPSLHLRTLRAGHETRHSARYGRLCHSRRSHEGHSGPHSRQGRLYGPFPQTEITSVRRWFRLKMDAAQQFWRGVSFSELFQNGGGENGSAFSGSSRKIA